MNLFKECNDGYEHYPKHISWKKWGVWKSNEIVEMFDYFKDDLPNPDSFVAELLQWQVSSCNFLFINISIDIV